MKNHRQRQQPRLSEYLEQFREKAQIENFPSEILSIMQKLSQLLKHTEIDVESLLQKTSNEREKSIGQVRAFAESKMGLWNEIKDSMNEVFADYRADEFITTKNDDIQSVLNNILEEIQQFLQKTQERIDLSQNESEKWRTQTFDVKKQLRELEYKYNKLQQGYDTQESYMCRDYQLILEKIGCHPSGGMEQNIKHIIEGALKDIEVEVLWEQSKDNNGDYFVIQNDSEATTSGVVRPCLVKESHVIHKGVILNPIN